MTFPVKMVPTIDDLLALGTTPFQKHDGIYLKVSDLDGFHFYWPKMNRSHVFRALKDDAMHTVMLGETVIINLALFDINENGKDVAKKEHESKETIGSLKVFASPILTAGRSCHVKAGIFSAVTVDRGMIHVERIKTDGLNTFDGIAHSNNFELPEIKTQDCWEIIRDILGYETKAGYHLRKIKKGILGEASKIIEEAMEFDDAILQGVDLMALVELSDLQGAIRAYLEKHHPTLTLDDLIKMNDVTRRSFENGRRS